MSMLWTLTNGNQLSPASKAADTNQDLHAGGRRAIFIKLQPEGTLLKNYAWVYPVVEGFLDDGVKI